MRNIALNEEAPGAVKATNPCAVQLSCTSKSVYIICITVPGNQMNFCLSKKGFILFPALNPFVLGPHRFIARVYVPQCLMLAIYF